MLSVIQSKTLFSVFSVWCSRYFSSEIYFTGIASVLLLLQYYYPFFIFYKKEQGCKVSFTTIKIVKKSK
jgi:hypothetical protein